MHKVSDIQYKVCAIINEFESYIFSAGCSKDRVAQYSLALLCKAKGSCKVLSNIESELEAFGFSKEYFYNCVNKIQDICGSKLNGIIPFLTDWIIGDFFKDGPMGNFKQPKELTDLVLFLVKEKGCKNIYNPFAGFGSYAFADFIEHYYGQEIDFATCNVAKMRLELNDIDNSFFSCADSIKEWDDHGADCIVSTPPFGVKLTHEQREIYGVSTIDEFLVSKFISGSSQYGFFVVPNGFCFRTNVYAHTIRRTICDYNWLESVISLPSGIFNSASVSTSLIVLNKQRGKNDSICFVDAEKLFTVNKIGRRNLNVSDVLHAISDFDSNITYHVSIQDLILNDYSFDIIRYSTQDLSVSEGQKVVSLRELLRQDKGQRCEFRDDLVRNVLAASNYVDDIVKLGDVDNEVMVSQPKHKFVGPHLAINLQGKIYVNKGESSFYVGTALSNSVFIVNNDIVDIEYMAYKLLDSGILGKVIGGAFVPRLNTNQLLSLNIAIDVDKEKQRRIVSNIRRRFLENERKRLGIREAGGDLTHMLRMPKESIANSIDMLLSSEYMSEADRESVKSINDNFRYMLRLINMIGADFSSMSVPSHKVNIAELIKDYVSSLRHLLFANCFDIVEDITMSDEVFIHCDEDLIRVILDTAFLNAYNHGFEQKYSDSNKVKLGCRPVDYDGKSYVCITIANNGSPLTAGFSIEEFATRGKKAGKMGNTGKGGYHIFTIAKKYDGYINISSSEEWPFILDVLIPAANIDSNLILEEYGSKCI